MYNAHAMEQATLLREVITTVSRFAESRRRKYHAESEESDRAAYCFDFLANQEAFQEKFGVESLQQPVEIGRGWHGVAYKIGDYVMKIQHAIGPVAGFEYPQTKEGARLAKDHLDIMRLRANKHNLPYLIPEELDVFFVPLSKEEETGRIVTIQQYHPELYTPEEASPLLTDRVVRNTLREELRNFISFYIDSTREDGLLADVFGDRNLALREVNGELHFVLLDVGPVDRAIAGPIAQVGMSAAFVKEIVKWQGALALGSLRRHERVA